MSVYRRKYRDPKTGEVKESRVWWYDFWFAGKRICESTKVTQKTRAKDAETKRRRELEDGFNGIVDNRAERIRTVKGLAAAYLEDYKLRHKSSTFAEYALGHVVRLAGSVMLVDATEETVKGYQTARLKEKAAPKSINEEVGFLLRLLGEHGDGIRAKMKRERTLKLKTGRSVGKAFARDEKVRLLAAAKAARSPAIYPALMLALNAGMRDAEIRGLQWGRVDLPKAILTVGDSKTEAGEGRTIPLNSELLAALVEYSKWYTKRFGIIQPDWYVFAWGKPMPSDPARPVTTLKTAWTNVRTKAKVSGRWHDNRHTFITDLAESPDVSDETIRDMVGHVSKQMLKHYSHIRMQAKRAAVEALTGKKPAESPESGPKEEKPADPKNAPQVSPSVRVF